MFRSSSESFMNTCIVIKTATKNIFIFTIKNVCKYNIITEKRYYEHNYTTVAMNSQNLFTIFHKTVTADRLLPEAIINKAFKPL
jgi:hypothetical protein